jgi:predicted O-linked N-acetylglucosamine transferase (SPINDLY family)
MIVKNMNQLIAEANKFLELGDYKEAESLYQELVLLFPELKLGYWKLGLCLLLQEQELEAQMCWMSGLLDGNEEEVLLWTNELANLLESEAQHQLHVNNIQNSWLIRHHLREISPLNIENNLILIQLSVELDFSLSELIEGEAGIITLINNAADEEINKALLLTTLCIAVKKSVVNDDILSFIRVSFDKLDHLHDVRNMLVPICIKLAQKFDFAEAIALGELYLSVDPVDLEFLAHLPGWYSKIGNLPKSIEAAKRRIFLSDSEIEIIFSRHLLIKIFLQTGGYWTEACQEIQANKVSLLNIKDLEGSASVVQLLRLISTVFFTPYIQDEPTQSRLICNHIAQVFSEEIGRITPPEIRIQQNLRYQKEYIGQKEEGKRNLRVGYISYCFRRHSVGWIARWLLKYHNQELFETYGYLVGFDESDQFQGWYSRQFDHACRVGIDCLDTGIDIANKIAEDQIDILIDLDSITLDFTCEVMVHKPAPVQITWLGWDASGIPQIDYYIADPYVLPNNAQEYYAEKIWRLPQTYVAVDGFEVEVPTISRESLNIPKEAVIYLTAQGGYKRHPDSIRLQLEIIKAVPNSYLLVKGTSDIATTQAHFFEIADLVNISKEQLIFLPIVASEEVHRANLRIADVVLDTFPYNGATTTLETLWMEIPLVTLVGKQFSARNSYTMLKNVGVEDGIAWTAEEYVQWGIRFGTDSELRRKVSWELRESKKGAPLWNTKKFAQQMENSYLKMWEIYKSSLR